MLLAVDVGNTQTHLGAFDGERLVEHWRFQTRSGATGDELAERIAGLIALDGMALADLGAVCVSSVVPPLGVQYEQMTARYLEGECLTIGPGVKTGMSIRSAPASAAIAAPERITSGSWPNSWTETGCSSGWIRISSRSVRSLR